MIQVALLTVAMLAVLRRVVTSPRSASARSSARSASTRSSASSSPSSTALIDRIQSGAFFEGAAHPAARDFLFFSYTTLTTTGYGNLVPGGQPGRMISGLEMMIGQIFLVTLVAGLVSLWRPGEGSCSAGASGAEGRRAEARPASPQALVGELDALDRLRLDRLVAGAGGGADSIASTASMPSVTLPKTVCLPSSQGAASVVTMKNWEPLVLGPALAIASAPRTILWSLNSSSKV